MYILVQLHRPSYVASILNTCPLTALKPFAGTDVSTTRMPPPANIGNSEKLSTNVWNPKRTSPASVTKIESAPPQWCQF